MIPLFKVFMSQFVADSVSRVLRSGFIGEGPKAKEFEEAIGRYIGNPNTILVNSCTSAIMMSLRLAGIRAGDLVATTPMTCLATNEPILALGATPIWIDVDMVTGNMLPGALEHVLSNHVGIEAVLCVHWGGVPCDMLRINDIAHRYDISVIEDAAHAFGTEISHTRIGNHSDFVCFSFQAIKTLTCGDGGAILVKDPDMAKRARLMRWYGLDREESTEMRCHQDPTEYGYNMHMNDISATIGMGNLKYIDGLLKICRGNASAYDDAFGKMNSIRIANIPDNVDPSYWLYTIIVHDAASFIAHMRNRDIICSKVHERNDTKTMFASSRTDLPGVTAFDTSHVCIPVGWWVSLKDREHIIKSVKEYN